MSGLRPQPFAALLGRALAELESGRELFGLPRRSLWKPKPGLDLSVPVVGGRAATPLGPAAGPHTQLAHNIVVAWLAGARAIELKTVQVKDDLVVPRPCIDAAAVGYNVEWSQELRLEQSLEQYLAAWLLVHVLGDRGVAPVEGTVFDASVGYDLAGIRSEPVARFLATLADAATRLDAMRAELPFGLRAAAGVPVPSRIVHTVTLSTFHGCPVEEIEGIVTHLIERHGLNVVVKLNPTLLGLETVETLLHGALGYDEVTLDSLAFRNDLGWERALALLDRLSGVANRCGRALGVKLTNTLVVMNTRGRLAGERVYLSGPPLHVLAVELARRLSDATHGRLPIAFSGGIEAENFADAVACGFAPVTTCTDLLKPTGYRRLPRYLKALEAEMAATGSRSVGEYILARAGRKGGGADDPAVRREAAARNLATYAAALPALPRYHAAANREETPRLRPLALFDCESCNRCVLVCPNGAFFGLDIPALALEAPELVVRAGAIEQRPGRLATSREAQWAVFADFCNDCGNCDTFCPESGGPQNVKPRFYGSREGYETDAPRDGILVEEGGARIASRWDGVEHLLVRRGGLARWADGVVEVTLDASHGIVEARPLAPREGHVLPLARYHAVRLLAEALARRPGPVPGSAVPA